MTKRLIGVYAVDVGYILHPQSGRFLLFLVQLSTFINRINPNQPFSFNSKAS
jgi:hypothetical protein